MISRKLCSRCSATIVIVKMLITQTKTREIMIWSTFAVYGMIVSMARSHVPASPKSCDSNAQMFLESHTAWSSKSHRGCHPLLWETRVPGFSNLDNSTPTSSLLKKRPRDFRVVIYLKLHVSSGFGMRLWHQLHVWCLGIFKCVLSFFI